MPISFRPVGGFFGFPDSLMGTIGYARQVLDDTSWYAQAEPIYEAAPTKNERIPYDRTEERWPKRRQRKEVVLLAGEQLIQILRRSASGGGMEDSHRCFTAGSRDTT